MAGRFPTLIRIARHTYGRILTFRGKISLRNESGADLKTGPYLYLLNHCGVLDPVMVSALVPRHIRWVAGAYLFKTRFLNLVIGKGCTAIPKQQGRSDVSTVRNVQRALKEGDNVGIFPEGTRTWDGEMVPINYMTLAKLVRMYRTPVLFVHLEGAFAHHPRWADEKRKGKVVVNVKHLLPAEQIASMDLETLRRTIEHHLRFSNDQWKRKESYSYVSTRRAEGIQRLLYLCPQCRSVDTISSVGNRISCKKCNALAVLDEMDDIISVDVPFTRLHEWHSWEALEISGHRTFPVEKGVLLQKGDHDNNGKLRTISRSITVQLKDDVLTVDCKDGRRERLELPLGKMNSLILNAKQTMELFCGDDLYRIRLLPGASSLKYHEYYLNYMKTKEDD